MLIQVYIYIYITSWIYASMNMSELADGCLLCGKPNVSPKGGGQKKRGISLALAPQHGCKHVTIGPHPDGPWPPESSLTWWNNASAASVRPRYHSVKPVIRAEAWLSHDNTRFSIFSFQDHFSPVYFNITIAVFWPVSTQFIFVNPWTIWEFN